MTVEERVLVLLAAVLGAVLSYDGFDQCSSYPEYSTLVNLIQHDECMNIDSVFKLLADITIKEHAGTCRNHVIYLLAEHFGPHARTPQYCQCQGTNMLQEYHMGPRDGVPDNRDTCLKSNAYYRNLYNQFFQSNHSHGVQACRTHHSLWNSLRNVETHDHGHVFSCLKDIIFHLKYAFQYHTDKCSCSSATVPSQTNGPQEHHGEHYYDHHCHQLDSFNKLQRLGDSDACLSANSVWHYLDNLQVISPKCRKRIQKHMADKYRNATSQDGDTCSCRERGQLVDNVAHRLNNGSTHGCKTASDDYMQVRTDLLSHNAAKRCQNHNYLWNKLEHIQNYCGHYDRNNTCTRYVDCTQDLIVRGANHYPTDDSDGCVCEKKTAVITTPSKDPMTQAPSTTDTLPMASATSRKAAHVPTTIATTLSKFSCDKQAAIEAIAKSIHVAHSDSSPCGASGNGSDDAYILSVCKITSPSTWKKGANVMSDCESATPVIPTYTPISTFTGDNYNPLGAQSGIFLGCSNNGIKMAIQKCNGVPIFIQVESGTFFENPRNYFVIN